MRLKTIDHIAINTVDINKSIGFYSEIMGFELLERVQNGDNTLVYMKINESSTIELFDHEKEIDYFEHPGAASGLAHIAFGVCDIHDWYKHLKMHDVEFILPLCSLVNLGKEVMLIKDPNGVTIELSEDIKKNKR